MEFGLEGFIFSLIVSFVPLALVFLIYGIVRLFRKNSSLERFLSRMVLGFVIFTLFYIFIPSTINQINPPEDEYLYQRLFIDLDSTGIVTIGFWEASFNSFARYWGQMVLNSFSSYLFYPITLLPVIFILGAFITFFILLYQLKSRSPDKTLLEKIAQIQYEFDENPIDLIRHRLKNPDWDSAKSLLKILLAVLPISLYLLMTLLKVIGFQEKSNILQGTSLGWFLEIFFVYLASMMFAVHLLYSGKFSFEGNYLGEKLRNTMIQSLSTVGGLISAIAIVLFVIDYQKQLFVVIYFITYFIMVSLFFVLFLDIFEPISIYFVTKLVESTKSYTQPFILAEQNIEKDAGVSAPVEDIFVPEINFDELMGKSTPEPTSISPPIQKEPIIEEDAFDKEIDILKDQEEKLPSLRRESFIDIIRFGTKFVLALVGIYLVAILFGIIYEVFDLESLFIATDVRVIYYVIVSLVFSIPILLISATFFSRRILNITILAIAFHSILPILDWSMKFILDRVYGPHKFATIPYLNFYFNFIVFLTIIVLALSLYILRRWNWDPFSNLNTIYLIGLFFVFTYGFMFIPLRDFKITIEPFFVDLIFIGIVITQILLNGFWILRYQWESLSKLISKSGSALVLNGLFLIPYLILYSVSINNIDFIYLNSLQLSGHPTTAQLSPTPSFFFLFNALSGGSNFWITYIYRPIVFQGSSTLFYFPALTAVPVDFAPLLGILSIPFNFLQFYSAIMLYGLLFFFVGREFLTVAFKDEENIEKIVYSERTIIPTLDELIAHPTKFAVVRNFGFEESEENEIGSEIEDSIYQLSLGPIMVEFIGEAPIDFESLSQDTQLTIEEILSFFTEISKTALARVKPFIIFTKEFGYTYVEASLDSLHIMMRDGRSVFTHQFAEESSVEPALVSGLFSAITSFAQEAVRSEELLRTIDHGDVVLQIEYGQFVFGAIFSDKNSLELRNKLASFLQQFEENHLQELDGWLGDTSTFAEDWLLVNEIFGD